MINQLVIYSTTQENNMDKLLKVLDRNPQKNERPYYIIPDNTKSNLKIKPLIIFKSLNDLVMTFELKSKLVDNDYMDNEYLRNLKEHSLKAKKRSLL